MYIVYGDISLSKGHLGSRGGEHIKQTERRQFHLFNDKRHNFIFRMRAQKECLKVLEMESTSILNF